MAFNEITRYNMEQMANSAYHISNLLEKMCSVDKDFRFMATNDFMNELQKDNIKLDEESERNVVRMVLKLLDDKNGEVQNLAIKCLGSLVKKVQDYQVETIVDILCANMISEIEQVRDISSMGLKVVVSEVPAGNQNLVGNICRRVTGHLIEIIDKQDDMSIKLDALDILIDLLSRFGPLIMSFEKQIVSSLLPQLNSPRQAVRKRTIAAFGYFVSTCSTFVYLSIIDNLLQSIGPPIQAIHKTCIQCLATICRHSGHRFGQHIERIVPMILNYCQENDEEFHEYCLQAFDIFIERCTNEIAPYVPVIIDVCLHSLKYDPNYDYGLEIDEENISSSECISQESIEMETDEAIEDESSEEYSDDDDTSWKIRRAAAKCLETTVLNGNMDTVIHFYKHVSPVLIDRFKEREDNIKSDIFHVFIALLRKTKAVSTSVSRSEESPTTLLVVQIPWIIRRVCKLMRQKNVKMRQNCILLLKELIVVLPDALTNHVDKLIPGIEYSLTDNNSNTKIYVLNFLSQLFSTHSPEVFHPFLNVLVPLITTCVDDNFYKVTGEALQALQELIKIIRPLQSEIIPEFTSYINNSYKCAMARLCTPNIDQEVKDRVIVCMGQILYNTGDYLREELGTCLPILLDRLKNEITRITTIKTLNKIASSPQNVDLSCILNDVVAISGFFLRKNQRPLRLKTLLLLNTLVRNYYSSIPIELLQQVVAEMYPLINESDLYLTQLTLNILTSICELQPQSLVDQTKGIMSEVVTLVQSPMLQGATLQAVLDLIQVLVRKNLLEMTPNDLQRLFIQQAAEISQKNTFVVHKQALHSLAKCVAAVEVLNKIEALKTAEQFLKELQRIENDIDRVFLLFIIGEIGRHVNLDSIPVLKEVILECFIVPSEEVKSAASYALGSISIGNMASFVSFILEQIDANPKFQYLLLYSLKEVISSLSCTSSGVESLMEYLSEIWGKLFKYCELNEEGPRNIIAECLGKLTVIHPNDLLPRLQIALGSSSSLVRATVITTIKYTIMEQPHLIDSMLHESMGEFLKTLVDPDLNVRRMALITLNCAARNKPTLIRELLPNILPQLYQETKIKPDLIRELQMGPFKHTVDEGLDIRKAAFECMYTLLDSCLEKLDIFEFLNHVEDGLKDHYDIKMLTYLMVIRLTQLCPTVMLQRLEQILLPIRATCTLKLKANSVKQEYEKHRELKRSALRAVAALYSIPDAAKHPILMEFVNHVKITSDLKYVFETIQTDSARPTVRCYDLDTFQVDQN